MGLKKLFGVSLGLPSGGLGVLLGCGSISKGGRGVVRRFRVRFCFARGDVVSSSADMFFFFWLRLD